MGSLTIPNLDDSLIKGLEDRASRSGRTVDQEVAFILSQTLAQGQRPDMIARLTALRRATAGMSRTPSEILLQEDRDGDDR
ncbi:FitA-like ribbon-helix-helix domain-containing protein [Niveispirillum irakense]|uniref:FitA-like ribbon-helix-helix domain-containing protein n=1 Tax=Niveispirillum irakense TaxID=34011 RepID=UPI000402F079|nr:hypothetical protein [Niveispirillum irakense]